MVQSQPGHRENVEAVRQWQDLPRRFARYRINLPSSGTRSRRQGGRRPKTTPDPPQK